MMFLCSTVGSANAVFAQNVKDRHRIVFVVVIYLLLLLKVFFLYIVFVVIDCYFYLLL